MAKAKEPEGAGDELQKLPFEAALKKLESIVEAMEGNIVADFPVINKSFNLSYSGTDR